MSYAEKRLRRCDRCAAEPKFQLVLPSGGDLLFCAVHAYAQSDAIIAAGAVLPMVATAVRERVMCS